MQDKLLRRIIKANARLFKPLHETVKKVDGWCNECWKAKIQPAATGLLKDAEAVNQVES